MTASYPTTLWLACLAAIRRPFSASFSPPPPHPPPPAAAASPLSSRPKTIPSLRHKQLNYLIPLSQAWDASVCNHSNCQSFSDLVTQLDCRAFDSQGRLTTTSTINHDDAKSCRLYLATHVDDLPPIAQLTVEVFDATAITLSSTNDWSAMEKMVVGAVVQPAISLYNSYAAAVGYTEVLFGLRKRMRNRMIADNASDTNQLRNNDNYDWLAPLVVTDAISSSSSSSYDVMQSLEAIAAQSSVILVLARPTEGGEMQSVASVEVRLQPTDAKIPFSQPWLDKIERRLARLFPFDDSLPISTEKISAPTDSMTELTKKSKSAPLRPYLCNLCVCHSLRSLGIGRSLCRIVEAIAQKKWQYSHLYLHVDPANEAAVSLYKKEGFVDVGRRWNAKWNGGANKIGYYMKKLAK